MESRTDYSFGLIPIARQDNDFYFLLINQSSGDFWSFPKGHPEQRESEVETATRELIEETGIRPKKVFADQFFLEKYSFNDDDNLVINKTVKFFPCFCGKQDPKVDQKEISQAKWCSYEEALSLITYQETRDILVQVNEWLFIKNL